MFLSKRFAKNDKNLILKFYDQKMNSLVQNIQYLKFGYYESILR